MIVVTLTQLISAPPERVWQELADLQRHQQWMVDAERITFRTEQRTGIGTAINCRTKMGPFTTNDVMTVTEWIDQRRIAVDHAGLVHGHGVFELHHEAGGTSRVVWQERIRLPWLPFAGPVGEVFARPLMRFLWKRNLASLARLCAS